MKNVTPSPQLVETFTLRPRGPDTLLTCWNKTTEPFKTSSGLAGLIFSTGIIKIQGVHCLKLSFSASRPRNNAGIAGKTLAQTQRAIKR